MRLALGASVPWQDGVTVAEDTDHAVARQVRAWNEGDLEAFLACFREDVVVEDADGNVQSMGRDALRTTYGQLLADQPDREYKIVTRIRVGPWVVDEERITGGTRGDSRAIGIYHLGEDVLIDRVCLLG